uniref:Uncharacterized protein n=1 Tax=Glossina pallidipes TaxID=7398 RepID=A0A1B0AIG2_GLOPL
MPGEFRIVNIFLIGVDLRMTYSQVTVKKQQTKKTIAVNKVFGLRHTPYNLSPNWEKKTAKAILTLAFIHFHYLTKE